jgi:hypothetical protein
MTLVVSWRGAIVGVCAVLLTSTMTIHAGDQSKDRDTDRDDAPRVRLPQLGPAAQVPACYNSVSGEWRVVHPWSSKISTGAVCRPPAPWDTVNVPAGGWGQVICTAGGAFDCDANESFIAIDSRGPQGLQGPIGAPGVQGSVGPQGPTGPVGPIGPVGATGDVGPQGPKGDAGPQGAAGEKGEKGEIGGKGDHGDAGEQGPSGPIGPRGLGFTFRGEWDATTQYRENDVVTEEGRAFVARGDNVAVDPATAAQVSGGAWALMAAKGDVGPTGPQGDQGPQGLIGPVGPQGPAGAPGATGPTGPSGTTGQGAGSVVSTSQLTLTTAALTDIPGLSLGANVATATSALVVSSDGGVQVSSTTGGQAVVVDIFLFVDGDTTPKQIVQKRIYAVNSAIVPNVANWSFTVAVSGLAPGTAHTFRVAAQLAASTGAAALVAGGASSVLRGTLTVVAVNK